MVKTFRRYIYSFWLDPRTWRTDGRTPHHSIYRAYAYASRGKNWELERPWNLALLRRRRLDNARGEKLLLIDAAGARRWRDMTLCDYVTAYDASDVKPCWHVIGRRAICPVGKEHGKNWRGLWGLDLHWKTDNPHCKHQGKKLGGGRVSTPLGPDSCECIHHDIVSFSLFILHAWPYCNCNYIHSLSST